MDLNNWDIMKQIEFINEKLREGYTLTKLDNENIISSRKTISNRFKKVGYEFNKTTKQFESIVEIIEADNVLNEVCMTIEPTEEKQQSSNLVVEGEQVNNKLLEEIILNYNDMNSKLNEVYKWYQESINKVVIEDKKLVIEDFEGKLVSRSFKLYEPIQKEFTDFCKMNNKYKVQDILCQALKEYMEKYN